MLRFCCIASLLACATVLSAAQSSPPVKTPEELSVCDLIQNAPSYEGHLVRVRGEIVFEFENFVIGSGPGCEIGSSRERNPVWLTYGGDETDPAVYCCGSHAKTKGEDLEIEGHRLPLVRDGAYWELRDRLQAKRLRRPDGSMCYDECKFYRVTATITGTFFAAKSDSETFSGYGHLGCCNLLVIQQVSEVSAERTDVPVGGEFHCKSETWTPSESQAQQLKILRSCDEAQDGNCDTYDELAVLQIAQHWKENLDPRRSGSRDGYRDIDGSLVTNWLSSDLLTEYIARSKPTRGNSDAEGASITRKSCSQVASRAPKLTADVVSCSEQSLGEDDEVYLKERFALIGKGEYSRSTQRDYQRAKRLFSKGDQSWRFLPGKDAASYLLAQQAEKWKIDVAQLTFDKCDDDSSNLVDLGQMVSCSWFTPDGMQSLDVSLLRHTGAEFSADDRKIPWAATWVHAHICKVQESRAGEETVPLH